jgi:serine/threonine protein kinase/tetratricopeptide (TPR) repeat protein
MPISEGTRLGRYEIRSQLGAGGMGKVYLAKDTKLNRKVAIKFLATDSSPSEQANMRLLREARAAATLDHPNICAIHEVGEEEDRTFIVMQYVEGQTLNARLKHKPLELKESLILAEQIADALAEAHSRGIIHRDIKPSNIIVTSRGQAKVMDFGLAKLIQQSEVVQSQAETEALLSTPGAIIGTVPYMSPEQVRGEALDERSDIFSLGIVLYEMLSGQQPFASESSVATAAAILTREPPPLERYCAKVPNELDRIVRKTLRKQTDERYQTAKDLLIDLRSLKGELQFQDRLERSSSPNDEKEQATPQQSSTTSQWSNVLFKGRPSMRALAALVILASLAVAFFYFRFSAPSHSETAAAMKTIAVLPFRSIGAEGDNEYLELGMADALITRLSNVRGIVVRSTSSVSKYTGLQQDAVAAGRELGVDSVLDGSVQKIGDRIRVTVRLIRIKDAAPLWAETFDQNWTDILNVQSSIAQKVAGALAPQLTGEEKRLLSKRYTDNAEAYQLYLKGRYSSNKWTSEGFHKGIEYFNQAIGTDPGYAFAYAGLADCYSGLSTIYMPPKEVMPKMKEFATKAVALDESLAEAHSSLSVALGYHDMDWSGAEKEIRRAIELNPNNAQIRASYGDLLSALGRFDEATAEFKKAQELDPTSAVITGSLAYHFIRKGDYDRAIEESQKALELEPDNQWSLGAIAFAYLYKDEPSKALSVFQKQRQLAGIPSFALEGIGRSYAAMGERAKALNIIAELREASKREYVSSYPIATIYLQLGDKDKALEYLEKTYEERNTNSLVILKTDRQFDVLRSDPRFIKLLRQLNFNP